MGSERMFDYSELPENLQGGMERYVEHGIGAGHFLTAILCNDLAGAVSHADSTNIHNIPTIVKWLYNKVPQGCWGSVDNVKEWTGVNEHGVHIRTFGK